jgi:hypothetical protein
MLKLTSTHKGICRKGKGEQNMNRKIMKFSSLTLTLMIVLSCFIAFHVSAQTKPRLYVDPAENTFFTDTTSVGAKFTVSIKAADFVAPGVYSYQFKLFFDKTMLQASAAAIPDGHWLTPANPANIFKVDSGTIDNATGFVSFGVTMLSTEAGKIGGGVIATVTFQIMTAPPAGGSLTSLISLGAGGVDTLLVDPSASEIPASTYDIVAATFKYASPPLPKPFMSVSSFDWTNAAADAAGRLFNVSVNITKLVAEWHAVGFQFTLGFDNTMLATKPEWVFAGNWATQFGASAGGTFNITFVEKDVIFGEIILPPWPDPNDLTKWAHNEPNGTDILATIQFNATYRPPPEGSSDLVLSNTLIVDYQGQGIETDPAQNGKYVISTRRPFLSVLPKEITLAKKGDSFDLSILMNNLTKDWRMVGVEFKVRYNTTLLETKSDSITEGDFLKGFAEHVGTTTFFQAYLDEDHGLIGIIILPLPNGTWPLDVFPDTSAGPGLLAKMKFTAINQAVQDDLISYLQVYDALLVDVDAKEIPTNTAATAAEGVCKCTILKEFVPQPIPPPERRIDLFTQYPDPYGGQGLGNASDAFAPQGQAQIFGYVTYRGEPVPSKPVAYQIRGPGGYEFQAVNFTDVNGRAGLSISIPASESYFGIWNITGSVDVAGQVVSDFVFFRVGWLISTKEITISPSDTTTTPGYQTLVKGSTYDINGTMKVITMQPPNICVQLAGVNAKVLLVYSGFDELGQPLFSQYMPLNVDYANTPNAVARNSFVLSNGRDLMTTKTSITIPSSAFSGVATIRGNLFTDFPWYLGVPYANPKLGEKKVWIKAFLVPTQPVSIKTWLEVQSITIQTKKTGSINIVIHDVDPSAHIAAIQFSLKFDTSLLNASKVTEGPFVKQFGDTFFTAYVENGVIVGELQLPPYPGPNGWMTGTGTIATIQFTALSGIGSCFLTLTDAFLVDNNANSINFLTLQQGIAKVTP